MLYTQGSTLQRHLVCIHNLIILHHSKPSSPHLLYKNSDLDPVSADLPASDISIYFEANIQLLIVILSLLLVEETPLKYPFLCLESCLPSLLCPDLYLMKVTLRMSVKTPVSWSVVKVQGRAGAETFLVLLTLALCVLSSCDTDGVMVSPALSTLDLGLVCPQQ